jgi:hypothetical protein
MAAATTVKSAADSKTSTFGDEDLIQSFQEEEAEPVFHWKHARTVTHPPESLEFQFFLSEDSDDDSDAVNAMRVSAIDAMTPAKYMSVFTPKDISMTMGWPPTMSLRAVVEEACAALGSAGASVSVVIEKIPHFGEPPDAPHDDAVDSKSAEDPAEAAVEHSLLVSFFLYRNDRLTKSQLVLKPAPLSDVTIEKLKNAELRKTIADLTAAKIRVDSDRDQLLATTITQADKITMLRGELAKHDSSDKSSPSTSLIDGLHDVFTIDWDIDFTSAVDASLGRHHGFEFEGAECECVIDRKGFSQSAYLLPIPPSTTARFWLEIVGANESEEWLYFGVREFGNWRFQFEIILVEPIRVSDVYECIMDSAERIITVRNRDGDVVEEKSFAKKADDEGWKHARMFVAMPFKTRVMLKTDMPHDEAAPTDSSSSGTSSSSSSGSSTHSTTTTATATTSASSHSTFSP